MRHIILIFIFFSWLSIQSQDVCKVSKNVKSNYAFLLRNPSFYKGSNKDNCVLNMLDTLTKYSIQGDTTAFIIIDKICSKGDGYIGEAMLYITRDIYYNNTKLFMQRLTVNPKSKLKTFLIWALSSDVSEKKAPELKRIKAYAAKQKVNLTEKESKLMDSIIKQINPKMYD